jgi:hypothetical protein
MSAGKCRMRCMKPYVKFDRYVGCVGVVPDGLRSLSPSRQRWWMWSGLLELTRDEIESDLVAAAAMTPQCAAEIRLATARFWAERGRPVARIGTDGLYHLWSPQSGVWCAPGGLSSADSELSHEVPEHFPVPKYWGDGRMGRWEFALLQEQLNQEDVPYGLRCPCGPRNSAWIPFCDLRSRHGRTRRKLLSAYGNRCGLCAAAPGVIIDHDHFSGVVRGLLCSECNQRVDWCPHVRDCPYADYLNDPPARELHLMYPGKTRDAEDPERAAVLGVSSKRTTPSPDEWDWTPQVSRRVRG